MVGGVAAVEHALVEAPGAGAGEGRLGGEPKCVVVDGLRVHIVRALKGEVRAREREGERWVRAREVGVRERGGGEGERWV